LPPQSVALLELAFPVFFVAELEANLEANFVAAKFFSVAFF
jgi:hypothetical protein